MLSNTLLSTAVLTGDIMSSLALQHVDDVEKNAQAISYDEVTDVITDEVGVIAPTTTQTMMVNGADFGFCGKGHKDLCGIGSAGSILCCIVCSMTNPSYIPSWIAKHTAHFCCDPCLGERGVGCVIQTADLFMGDACGLMDDAAGG
jgi:hypothetical protein